MLNKKYQVSRSTLAPITLTLLVLILYYLSIFISMRFIIQPIIMVIVVMWLYNILKSKTTTISMTDNCLYVNSDLLDQHTNSLYIFHVSFIAVIICYCNQKNKFTILPIFIDSIPIQLYKQLQIHTRWMIKNYVKYNK